MKKIKYSQIIYAFDIETTTTPSGVVAHYISNFTAVDFKYFKSDKATIINNIKKPQFCRTSQDISAYFEALNAQAEQDGKNILVYIHNLAYEFDYLIKNVDFVRDNFTNQNSLFIKPRIPLFVKLKNIELRCSYKLLNQSLEKLGDNLGFEKLIIDYSKQYFEFSKLPQIEYDYNARDTQLTLLAVLQECAKWDYIKAVDDIPLTATSFSRRNNDYINTSKDKNDFTSHCRYQKFYTKDFVDFLEKVYTGGYTHANAFFVGKALKNITSVDITSSYPHSMLHRNYPNFFHKFNGEYITGYFKLLIQNNNITYKEALRNYSQPFKRAFLAEIVLQNMSAKVLKNNNLILPLSISKCEDFAGCKSDNGRVFNAKQITVFVTEVDYWILEQFYNFDVLKVKQLYITKYYKPLENYILVSVRQYLHEKSTIKEILGKIEDGKDITTEDFYNSNKDGYIFSDDRINDILSSEDFEHTINDNYRVSKNRLNAQYGSNVQKLIQNSYEYDVQADEYIKIIEERVTAKVLKRDFIKGLYITAYSRLTLFCYALYLIDNMKCSLIYSDTDSWKIKGDTKKIIEYTELYNNELDKILNIKKDYFVGSFDVEGVYKGFSTLGCKKYIVEKKNKKTGKNEIQITIAGVNKYKGSESYTSLYNKLNNNFDLLVSYAFTPCTILDNSIIDKKCIKYHNEEYNEVVTDENGDSGLISGRNMCELVDSDFILMNYSKPAIREYIDYYSELQGELYISQPTVFYKSDSGEYDIKSITDWKQALKLYDVIELDKFDTVDFRGV